MRAIHLTFIGLLKAIAFLLVFTGNISIDRDETLKVWFNQAYADCPPDTDCM